MDGGARRTERVDPAMDPSQSNPEAEAACRQSAGRADWSEYALLRVTGPDRADFLNRLTTNQVEPMPGRGLHTFLLSVNGRPLLESWLYDEGDSFLLEIPRALVGRAVQEFDRYQFGEKLKFHQLFDTCSGVAVIGPLVRERLGTDELPFGGTAPFRWRDYEGIRCRIERLSVPAEALWVRAESAPLLRQALEEAGFVPVSFPTLERLRVEAGFPAYGRDYDEETLFLEMAPPGAYSEDKGCYPGQEVVARILHRGHINRKLRGLRWTGGEPLEPGRKAVVNGKEVARVTSVAGDLGLGYVRREYYESGTELALENGARARVEDRPYARL